MRYYYTDQANQPIGPVEEVSLHELRRVGAINRLTNIIEEGGAEWVSYESYFKAAPYQGIGMPQSSGVQFGAYQAQLTPSAKDKVRGASKDALHAFKVLLTDPVKGLSEAFDSLGETRARSVGLIFGLFFALSIVFVVYRKLPEGAMNLEVALKVLLASLVPYVGTTVGCAVSRLAFGKGNLAHDSFIGGSVLLPLSLFILIGSFMGVGNIEIILIMALFVVCLTIMLIFVGLTRISKVSERVATIAVPLVILISVWAAKIIYAEIIQHYAGNMLNSYSKNPFDSLLQGF